MSTSYQDLDVRVAVLEDKITFLLRSFKSQQESPVIGGKPRVISLEDVYAAMKAGLVAEKENTDAPADQ